ncbi:twin-arginine translocase subunit TatC [Arsenicicoccus piscis]|uniref:Sec-independent protein translocase protein TatC n=1 Tax=Arsenicicoccus piscis TaxID=673954 RepID=A0ABQ6HUF9_9MICO|nr:twin-arginine translocase subunit TatC [Arsenicicoccus piscis]MCH8628393.1 twin-arginine translocase subunit TatC [Arsenicicoccus piscis]GMA19723.1 Sec-independent protein translocase protein TatC [Arsenicicoccus piscis]GMA22017.1 Sec-independent protein translocase protein TatC [Arsenicicoccus piscis]
MSLGDHLREFRNRVTISGIAIVLASILGWVYFNQLLHYLTEPLRLTAAERGQTVALNNSDVTGAFSLKLQIALWVGVIVASPVWLYQLWAFIMPGLHRKEKRTALAFIATAVPLFLLGCYAATWALPNAITALLGFTWQEGLNIMQADYYITWVTRFILSFGLAFLLPVLLVALNLAHILPARVMLKGWRVAVVVMFVFAAMMSPTPDPWSMFALAIPLILLYFAAYFVALLFDRRRAKQEPDYHDLADDEASVL